ncbi:hypothetical protein AB0J80_32810 [Actinoplanes sp. NPDC049548]|uniref:hypothetical protein n=1 Tax=Actinoplanes sp. NPDC049548 TaxID=3155152 RepID=UPI0034135BB8
MIPGGGLVLTSSPGNDQPLLEKTAAADPSASYLSAIPSNVIPAFSNVSTAVVPFNST